MKKLMLLILLSFIFLSCKSTNDVTTYDLRNNTRNWADNSYGFLLRDGEEKLYFLGEAPILLQEVDLKTFKAYEETQKKDKMVYDAEDKNNYYHEGVIAEKK